MPDLASPFPEGHTWSMQVRPAAAGLTHDAARDEPGSARVAEARDRAGERRDAQRQALRPLGVLFIAVVVTASAQTHPVPGLRGVGLEVLVALAMYAAAVLTAIGVGWARRGPAAQVAVSLLIGGCGAGGELSRPLHADWCVESLPVRKGRRSVWLMQLRTGRCRPVRRANLRPPRGPHRHARHSGSGRAARAEWREHGRSFGESTREGGTRSRGSKKALRQTTGDIVQRVR